MIEILETDRELEFVARVELHSLWLINGTDERLYTLCTGGRWLICRPQDCRWAGLMKAQLRREAEKERGAHADS